MEIVAIITTKNRTELFEKAFLSAVNQTRKPDKIIVVSDSTKENKTIEKSIIANNAIFLEDVFTHNYAGSLNSAIVYIVQANLYKQHNYDNTYIATLDDDDEWLSDYLECCEKTVDNGQDFVVSGLIYKNEDGEKLLSIPKQLNIDDFLKGNPHIQGSNTFIKVSTLLQAGAFDENMSSTTDRDFFTRVMLIGATYGIVDKHLVLVNAFNDRKRITNGKLKKADGLQKFYYKYACLMKPSIETAFFDRAKKLFDIEKELITNIAEKEINIKRNYEKVYSGKLVIGFIATEYDLGLRLLQQLCSLQRKDTHIVVLANFENQPKEYNSLLEKSGYKYDILTNKDIKKHIQNSNDQFIEVEKIAVPVIKDIAVARSILHRYLYELSNDGDVVWVLDDDMELKELVFQNNNKLEHTIDIDRIIGQYKEEYDAVVGNYSLDAPLPCLSTMRCSLLDYVYHKLGFRNSKCILKEFDDMYYDLSDANRTQLETPISTNVETDIELIMSGKAYARPLCCYDNSIKQARSRGGNTLIFDREMLKIPNWSLQLGEKIGRRSDYFWVLQAKEQGYNIVNVPFSTYHNRSKTQLDLDKELDKLLLDLIGASFTKTIEKVALNASKDDFYKTYTTNFLRRLSLFYMSYCRVQGLLKIVEETAYLEMFNEERLLFFVKTTEPYLKYEKVVSAYESLRYKCDKQRKMQTKGEVETWLKKTFGVNNLRILGNGGEGIVFTDGKNIYKHFFARPKNWDDLKDISKNFGECEQLYAIKCIEHDEHYVIIYPYQNATEYTGGHNDEMAAFIAFAKQHNFVFTNFKRDNFVVMDGKLKMIDYGKSFEPFTQKMYDREICRAYEMLRYPFLSIDEFKQMICRYYLGKTDIIDIGMENLRRAVEKRYKEEIHDGIIYELIEKYHPAKILDYGAGKCKITNTICDSYDCSVFDIDQAMLQKRANAKLTKYVKYDDIPNDEYDMVICNLVLCCVENNIAEEVLEVITNKMKLCGHLAISICHPFFNNINHTELREKGMDGDYHKAQMFDKQNRTGALVRQEYHRPIDYYVNLLQRYGFQIQDIRESTGTDIDNLIEIGEHLVFDCQLVRKDCCLEECSLMIKTNPMEHVNIYENIKHIVLALEKQVRFVERIVVVDCEEKIDRVRRYCQDNFELLKEKLELAQNNGLIDRIVFVPRDEKCIKRTYYKYFAQQCSCTHAKNGQGLFATLYGLEQVKTKYIFQTDSDILYHIKSGDDIKTAVEYLREDKVTVSLSIPHSSTGKNQCGTRVEVRSCVLDLEKLQTKLPLENHIENNKFVLPWHRALDNCLLGKESLRLFSNETWFVHPQNSAKTKENFIAKCERGVFAGNIPLQQYDNVNIIENAGDWCRKTQKNIVLYIRGYNTTCSKLKRLFESIKRQTVQNFEIVYVDDASVNGSKEYVEFLFDYDKYFADRTIALFNNKNVGELENFVFVMQNIIVEPQTIVINIDNDDFWARNDAIEIILKEFDKGADLTCGNCLRYDKPLKEYKIYSFDEVWKRNGDNIWLHPKCFRRKLFDYIDIEDDLKIDGEYVKVNTDFAMMIPLVQKAKKCKFIEEVIYYFEPSIDNQQNRGIYASKEKIKQLLLDNGRKKYGQKCTD